jgi:hypothetical protein
LDSSDSEKETDTSKTNNEQFEGGVGKNGDGGFKQDDEDDSPPAKKGIT